MTLSKNLLLLWHTFFDSRTPKAAKIGVILGLLYGIFPFDLVPDFLLLVGQMDDLGILLLMLFFFWKSTHDVRKKIAARQ